MWEGDELPAPTVKEVQDGNAPSLTLSIRKKEQVIPLQELGKFVSLRVAELYLVSSY